jgi:hypothetical protein
MIDKAAWHNSRLQFQLTKLVYCILYTECLTVVPSRKFPELAGIFCSFHKIRRCYGTVTESRCVVAANE